jgi:hypothetical protein
MFKLLRQIVPGGHMESMGAPTGCVARNPMCPATVVGRFHGFRIVAIAFWHMVLVREGKPARGAVRLPDDHSRLHPFFSGSDVVVVLRPPQTLSAG